MTDWLRRIRGALGIGALGALGFHLIGWLILGFEAVSAGMWPSLEVIGRMTMFTIPVGGFVGLLTAGAIALGAGSTRRIGKGRAFLIGLPLGAVGGVLLSLSAGGLTPLAIGLNGLAFAAGTGALGAGAVAVAGMADDDALPSSPIGAELPSSSD